jgi:hypothetical protein
MKMGRHWPVMAILRQPTMIGITKDLSFLA